jgi:hypothetical protein
MAFNATFNNIAVISWRSVLLVGETGVPEKTHRPAASDQAASGLSIKMYTVQNTFRTLVQPINIVGNT